MTLTADQLRGRVRVLIEGEEKVLRYDQGALASLIESLGLEGLASLPSAIAVLDADVLRKLIWAGRLHEQPKLKEEHVSKEFYAIVPTYAKCIEGINLAIWGLPDGPEEEEASEEDNDDADPTKVAVEDGTSGAQNVSLSEA